jgi:UDP-N-acetylglucosamine 1-carboxyvinyltransferase
MLNSMGARILGIGTNRLVVHGVEALRGTSARVGSDIIEAASYLVAAAVTGGALVLEGVDVAQFEVMAKPMKRFGLKWTSDAAAGKVELPANQRLRMRYDLGDTIPSVADGPWPMFPSDLMSVMIVLATQTRGTCLFHEKMFESRLYFVDHLIQMGAKIVLCDPHRAVVTGPSPLRGTTVTSPDIRAGIALVIAALCAKGESVILNAGTIDRGYVAVESSLTQLGADIRRR